MEKYFLLSLTDYANRGKKKFGDKCESTTECGFPDSICDSRKRSCQCVIHLPVTNHIDKCGKGKPNNNPSIIIINNIIIIISGHGHTETTQRRNRVHVLCGCTSLSIRATSI